MVHLTYELNHNGHLQIDNIIKDIQDFIKEKHGYIPFNTSDIINEWDDSIPQPTINFNGREVDYRHFWTDQKQSQLFSPISNYQRNSEWSDKCHIEYGWQAVADAGFASIYHGTDPKMTYLREFFADPERHIISHRGAKMPTKKMGVPGVPGQVIYTLKIRKITDWTYEEQEDLRKFIDNRLQEKMEGEDLVMYDTKLCDLLYREPHLYSEREFSDFQNSIDWSFTQAQAIHNENLPTAKSGDKMWCCRICKGVFNCRRDSEHHDFGANPEPIYANQSIKDDYVDDYYRKRVCQGCDNMFVLTARLGGDPWHMNYPEVEAGSKPACINPFIYPKQPVSLRHGHAQQSMCMSACGPQDPEIDWKSSTWQLYSKQLELLDIIHLNQMLDNLRDNNPVFRANCEQFEKEEEKRQKSKHAKQALDELMDELWDMIDPQEQTHFFNRFGKNWIARQKKKWQEEERQSLVEEKAEVEAQKAEVRNTANEARRNLEAIRQAQQPGRDREAVLRTEIANRDRKIASLKAKAEYIDNMPVKMKMKLVLRDIKKYEGEWVLPPKLTGIPQVVIDDYKHKKSLEAKAQQKKPVKKNKKEQPKAQCLICEKMFPKNSLCEVNGDLFCRVCK